jgi:UDP-2,4-diacetamido-2,4,6-trideoxy-beta-L-altropyranose hydrolase
VTMRVAFRVDSSALMGTGHLMRCLTLANELRRCGAATAFICRQHDGSVIARAEQEGHTVHRLARPGPSSDTAEDYAAWLGVPAPADAAETLLAVSGQHYDWLVVDHYGLDHEWEQRLRGVVGRLLVIDDLANRRHDCDLLLDQNYFAAATRERYRGLVAGPSCKLLLGPSYALLRPEYAQLRSVLPPRDGVVRRALIFFGGSDRRNDTKRVLDALCCSQLAELAVDVVIGSNHIDRHAIEEWVAQRSGAALYCGLPSLAGLLARADLAIGGGGSTTWERACLAVPSVIATIADNQIAFSAALDAQGYHVLLGDSAALSMQDWRTALTDLINDRPRLRRLSTASASLTDGLGAARVAGVMLSRDAPRIVLGRDAASGGQRAENEQGIPLALLRIEQHEQEAVAVARIELADDVEPVLAERVLRTLIRSRVGERSYLAVQGAAQPASQLRVTVLSDATSWLNEAISGWLADWAQRGHRVKWVHDATSLTAGEVCFLIGCSKLLSPAQVAQSTHTLVVHESALPEGRGWSPMTWQVLQDRRQIVVTLLEVAAKVDAGRIHLQTTIELTGQELVAEWRELQARATEQLCTQWIATFPEAARGAREQSGPSSYYRRRQPDDSKLDPQRPLAEQFDLLRVVDNARYPAFFNYRGRRYRLLVAADGATDGVRT